MYNSTKLHEELVSAGLSIDGCNSSGVVFWIGKPTQADLDLAEQVKAAHDPDAKTVVETQLDALRQKLSDGTMDFSELKAYLKLKEGL